jgi:hypothetical protein
LEEKPEKAKPTEVNVPKTMETDQNTGFSPISGRHRKMPAELNCQIFYCLNLPTRRKFIWGLGWNFYAMFRQILLTKVFLTLFIKALKGLKLAEPPTHQE